jgi:hypothetical protein
MKLIRLINRRRVVFATMVVLSLCFPLGSGAQTPAQKAKASPEKPAECSLSKTNQSCWLIIDRRNALAPSTIQMYSGEILTVVVKNPYTFERYFLDYQSGQAALKPDVAASVIQPLLSPLQKAGEIKANILGFGNEEQPTDVCANFATLNVVPGQGGAALLGAQVCMGQLARKAIGIYRKLEPFVSPDSIIPAVPASDAVDPKNLDEPCDLAVCMTKFLATEDTFSFELGEITADKAMKASTQPGDEAALIELAALQKTADSIASDIRSYSERLSESVGDPGDMARNGFQKCGSLMPMPDGSSTLCVVLVSRKDDPDVYNKTVTRTITYSLNTFNLVSNAQEAAPDPSKKKLLVSVAINFADAPTRKVSSALRWEASAGAFFSTLPIRSFSVAPIFANGVITDKKVMQNVLHPTVVPFAAVNYRLTNDLPWSRWKTNFYWTGAVGVNPNTVSADFATGFSYSFRSLMLSALAHFGHDTRLTQGFQVGESLGASFNATLPMETYWTTSFAFGVSVRVPSLMGR